MAAGVQLGDIVPCKAEVKLGKMVPFEFNPRGNLWYNDENTFGHKLLSRMGWSKGKGLGKHEDGIKENIKIGKKDNLTGVGWKSDVHISVGCAEYENILKKLQHRFKKKKREDKKPDGSKELESLEKRSQTSRSRLHYQKYVRAKDFFTRSEKDLKCIFLDNPKDTEEENLEKEKEMHTHTSDLSVGDYFAKKMKEKLGKMVSNSKEPIIKPEPVVIQETSKKVKNECIEFEQPKNLAEVKLVIKSKKEFSNKHSKNRRNALDNFNESVNVTEVEEKIKYEKDYKNLHGSSKKQKTSLEHLNEDIDSSKNKLKAKPEKEFVVKQTSKRKRKKSSDSSIEHIEEIEVKSENEVKSGKKLSKKRKNSSEDIVQLKKIKLESEELSDGVLYSSVTEKSCSVEETPDVEVKPKSKKSKKKKSHKLRGLKSCIKRSMSYNLKRDRKVFFNEQVSYKILDTSFESLTPINDLAVEEQNVFEESVQEESVQEESVQNTEFINAEGFMTNIRLFDEISSDSSDDECMTSVKHNKTPVIDSRSVVTNIKESIDIPVADSNDQEYKKNKKHNFKISTSKLHTNDSEDSPPECFNLPKSASSDLNMWLESQRAATKMTVYKDMVKNMKKDQVLRTTNLLDIKGYGNWEL